MVQRVAITIAGLVATIVLAFGLVAAGFGPPAAPEDSPLDAGLPLDPDLSIESLTSPAEPEPETVYVQPAPPPRTVVVRRRSSATTDSAAVSSDRRVVRDERDHDDRYEREDHDDGDDREERERDDD